MSKRNLLNLSLFAFIAALIVVVIYEPGQGKALEPTTLTNLNLDDITSIKINRKSLSPIEKNIEFKKINNQWIMVKPYKIEANIFRIDSILKLVSAVSFSQNNLANLEKNTFGLDTSKVSITFNNTKIIFGHNKSLKNHRYVEINSTLHMIQDTFHYQLVAKSESYISHKVLPKNAKIIKIVLPKFKLEQIDGRWISNNKEILSAESINQLVDEWKLSQAYDVNKLLTKIKYKKDILVYLDTGEIINFHIEENKKSFNLVNTSNYVRYILSADRKNKLLSLSSINEDQKE